MSISAIASSLLANYTSTSSIQEQEFKQLGQDLQSGNLSAAQQDYVTLQQELEQNGSASTTSATAAATSAASSGTQSDDSLAQLFEQLGKDLQSGNLSGAQQDFTNLQQQIQNRSSQQTGSAESVQGHRHHHGGDNANRVSQLFEQLGQSLQSGDLSSAQSAFSSLQSALGLSSSSSTGSTSASTFSVNA